MKELLSLFENRQQENPFVSEIGDIWLTMVFKIIDIIIIYIHITILIYQYSLSFF